MLRIIQVGMGGWGRDWARVVLRPDDTVELAACVDADAASLALARRELDLPQGRYFGSLQEALASTEAEAVLITAYRWRSRRSARASMCCSKSRSPPRWPRRGGWSTWLRSAACS
jgi:hypothetical protein